MDSKSICLVAGGALAGALIGYGVANMSPEYKRRKLAADEPMYLCIGGDRSGIGKSTVSLGLIMAFLENGYDASELAYIKPCTQCVSVQMITKFCKSKGIKQVSLGPVVYKRGYTYDAIDEINGSNEARMEAVLQSILDIGKGKKIVVVDGVGYASVGSVAGVSNAQVAAALGAPSLLISAVGVGDAIDRTNLNLAYYKKNGAKVLGCMYNVKQLHSRHTVENCEHYVTKFFTRYEKELMIYGWLPPVENPFMQEASGCTLSVPKELIVPEMTVEEAEFCDRLKGSFLKYIEVPNLLLDLRTFYGK